MIEPCDSPEADDQPVDALRILARIDALIATVTTDAAAQSRRWAELGIRPDFQPSADNFAAYLALRRHDLRGLQRALMTLGLSSLGRLESRVIPTLKSVRAALCALTGQGPTPCTNQEAFFAGERRLAARTHQLFGPAGDARQVALLVTCPRDAADDPDYMVQLARRGVEAVRINCAHDDPDIWAKMIAHARAAGERTGRRIRVLMDLAGPKIRTGAVRQLREAQRLFTGDRLAIVRPGALDQDFEPGVAFAAECSYPAVIDAVQPGQRLSIDDGKILTIVESVSAHGLRVRVTRCKDKGARLKAERGINLPDLTLHIPPLTDKDREDIGFIARHADGLAYSFIQRAEDIIELQAALAQARPDDWQSLALILKIETAQAVSNLPDIVMQAGAHQPTAIMIARGDLAIEIGFVRMAEVQEEILWIGEAAQVPVIWATQVLEQLIKTGMPSRSELTDAAMAVRADCVMLNKGPFILEAIDALDGLLGRMEGHVYKKTPQLRPLSAL